MKNDLRLFVGVKDISQDGVPLWKIARWVEYGTETAPPRPAYQMGAEKALKIRKKQIIAAIGNIARAGMMKKSKMNKKLIIDREKILLTGIGQSAVAATKQIIKSGSTVNNAPATVKKKGFDHPWFETGLILRNVTYIIGT